MIRAALPEAGTPAHPAGALHTLLDDLVAVYAEGEFRAQAAAAREEYFVLSGKVFEDDAELLDARLAAFLEWYVIERPFSGGPPPVMRALEAVGDVGTHARFVGQGAGLARLATSHRSLFDVADVSVNGVQLEDILGGARFSVAERRGTAGFQVGDVLEARLIWNGDEIIFGKTFLFHPRDAREEILVCADADMAKGESRQDILFFLAQRHLRWHRLRHVGAARVYRE